VRLRTLAALAALVLVLPGAASAQDASADSLTALRERLALVRGDLDGMTEFMQTVAADLERLKRIKLSGYLQARWETSENKSDTVKVAGSPATLTPANTERFYLRRARLKLTYDGAPFSEGVIYVDAGADRTVRLLEATVTLLDPWTPMHQHRLTIGQMNVPFGYELERSSSVRELPERSRAENVLFPGERDRGVKLVDQWTPVLETTVGIFNGPGINSADYPAADPTRAKDFVARARALFGSFDVAASWLTGRAPTALTGADVSTDKTRFGLDAQGYYQAPRLGGGTLRAEFYRGHEVNPDSVKAWTVTNTAGRLARAGAPLDHFATDMSGGYVMWVQNLGEQVQLATRYDWYDPDTDVDHDRYQRWGVGLHAFWGGLTRVTLAYDVPRTETLVGGRWVDPKDDLWTLQVQQRY
jgi:hypothetical protein